jgi:ABC-type branched-subunit amino acid transport system substrate-binding protein
MTTRAPRRRCSSASGIARRDALAILGVWAAGTPLAATAEPGVSAEQVFIGQNITLQGGKNAYGMAALDGIRLLLEAVNSGGGVHGRKLVLRTLDDENKPAMAAANARKLVNGGAFILFGSIEGGPSTAVAEVAEELKVPFFGPMAGSPSLRRPYSPMVFPVRAEHKEEFRMLMDWGRRTGLKTIGFFHSDSDTGRQHLENVKLGAAELGMTVILPLPFKSDATDAQLDEMARQVAELRPDMMFNHGSVGLYGKLIARSRRTGSATNFMAVNSGSTQLANDLGPLAQGMVFAQVVPSPTQRKHALSREYQDAMARSRSGAALSYGGLEGYMTAKALVMALQAAGRDLTRASLVRTLERSSFELGGIKVHYAPGDHAGSRFVDLALFSREARFIH